MNLLRTLCLIGWIVGLSSCKKEEPQPNLPTGNLSLLLTHQVGEHSLLFDTLLYQNAANNLYSVTRLNYYISNIKLYQNNKIAYTLATPFYVDTRTPITTLTLPSIPVGYYTALTFTIGLDAEHNLTGTLPNTDENRSMQWPDAMGGGYHFLKLEGYYTATNQVQKGYALHLGLNFSAVQHQSITLEKQINVNETAQHALTMNVNEWFQNPVIYDLTIDPNYSMGDTTSMLKISTNGTDVFYTTK